MAAVMSSSDCWPQNLGESCHVPKQIGETHRQRKQRKDVCIQRLLSLLTPVRTRFHAKTGICASLSSNACRSSPTFIR